MESLLGFRDSSEPDESPVRLIAVWLAGESSTRTWMPPADIHETDDELVVTRICRVLI
jgi:HSP20 family molecular chaperone IbpA